MTRTELDRLADHDLLVLLHERLRAHDLAHEAAEKARHDATIAFRWTVGTVIGILGVIAMAASVLGSPGNP